MFILGLIVTLLLIGGLTAGAIYLLYQLLTNFQPGAQKLNADLRQMQAEIKPWISDLVPWTKEEMELLSFNQVNKILKKGIAPTVKGIITSIYNEPMMAYSFKKYVSPGSNALLLVTTSRHEFVYRIKNKGVEVIIDGQPVGNMQKNGLLYSAKNHRLMARINRSEGGLMLPVIIGDREVGSLNLNDHTMKANTRAFQFLSEMNGDEEAVFLSLAAFEILKNELPENLEF